MSPESFMQTAIELAQAAALAGEVPVGAVVVFEDKIVGKSGNAKEATNIPTHHAEILAIEMAARELGRWRLTDCDLYVSLEPCLMCAGAIVNARLRKVYFATRDPKAGAVKSLYEVLSDSRLNHRPEISEGLLQENAAKLLSDFFRERRQSTKKS